MLAFECYWEFQDRYTSATAHEKSRRLFEGGGANVCTNGKMLIKIKKIFPVVMRIGDTPVHIPNTMVKPYPAWDTAPATVWESRWLPDHGVVAQLVRAHA